MENKLMKFINGNKWFVVFFLIWTFIHILLLMKGLSSIDVWDFQDDNDFWPYRAEIGGYGLLEFFVYESVPILIFTIWKLVGNDIKDKMKM